MNLHMREEARIDFDPLLGNEFIGLVTNEQFFYEDYYAYQPEYAAKMLEAARTLPKNGYTFINSDEMIARVTPLKKIIHRKKNVYQY